MSVWDTIASLQDLAAATFGFSRASFCPILVGVPMVFSNGRIEGVGTLQDLANATFGFGKVSFCPIFVEAPVGFREKLSDSEFLLDSLQCLANATFGFGKASFCPISVEAPVGFRNGLIEGIFVGSDPFFDLLFEVTDSDLDLVSCVPILSVSST